MTLIVEKNVSVPLRDGVNLRADVYRPAAPGRYPVLATKNPVQQRVMADYSPNLGSD